MRFRERTVCFVVLTILPSLTLLSCNCLPEPAVDVTPPTAGLLISYYIDGKSETTTVSGGDPSITIDADEDRDVTLIYSGQDKEGMRSLHLSVTVYKTIGGIQQREDANVAPKTLSCPQELLMGELTFERDQGERTIKVMLRSKNWMGLTTSTEKIGIVVKR